MRIAAPLFSRALILCGCLALVHGARGQSPTPRTAEVILKEINGVDLPDLQGVDRDDPIAVATYIGQKRRALGKVAALVGELYKVAPDNPRLPKLLAQRWSILKETSSADTVKDEVAKVLAESKEPKIQAEAAYFLAVRRVVGGNDDEKAKLDAIDAFIKLARDDPRGGRLLCAIASETTDPKTELELYKRIAHDYPDSDAASIAESAIIRFAYVGKPFALSFTDAIKGDVVTSERLKGKVVVIDFWATWCAPCVEGLPNLKRLYSAYHGSGVEFVGVSFDDPKEDGGLDQLKQFVAANDVPWPQYYLGNSFKSDFAQKWEVKSLPTLFVVDAQGNLYSTNAESKLEAILKTLVDKTDKSAASSGRGN